MRDPARAPHVPGAEIRRASGYGAFEEMAAALAGARTVFLIPATEALDRVEQHRTAVDAAVEAGVERIVYLSCFGAAADATFTLAREHWHTEQHVRSSGLAWTFLRMNLYIDFIPTMVAADGTIRGPAGDGRFAPVLRDDIAAAAAAVLTSPGHDASTYELTGPQDISLSEAAALMSAVSGREIRYQDETDEEAYESRAAFGAADFEVRAWVSSYQAIRDGSLEGVSTAVLELTGSEPGGLAGYLSSNPQVLAHVAR